MCVVEPGVELVDGADVGFGATAGKSDGTDRSDDD